ncbi:MAG TPA: ABC transporter permease [Chthonomonadales bacterium]|nr:ABC transporter permease [Chthonomonadales bacterium]
MNGWFRGHSSRPHNILSPTFVTGSKSNSPPYYQAVEYRQASLLARNGTSWQSCRRFFRYLSYRAGCCKIKPSQHGARRKDILWQFLIESAALSGGGGVIGIALGTGVALTLSKPSALAAKDEVDATLNLTMHLPLWTVLGAFTFSVFVGIFFGLYPAVRAACLAPIQALRHD